MVGTPENSREPCPDRILDDIGGAFGMGAVGGGLYHFLRGAYNSPHSERLLGGATSLRMHAPRVGGAFAVWGGLFSAFDCSLVFLRQKEDPWNSILSGAATGGLLQLRQGARASARSALVGGALLAMIEGVGITINKFVSVQQEKMQAEMLENLGRAGPGFEFGSGSGSGEEKEKESSWLGNLFGLKKKEEEEEERGVKVEVLESFDSPMPPTFEFK